MSADRTLEGLRIVVTRPEDRAENLAKALRAAGAQPVLIPTIRIEAFEQVPGLDRAIRALGGYDWVVFTSATAVELFLERLGRGENGRGSLSEARVAAIGPATAEALRERSIEPAFMPGTYVGEALAEGLPLAVGDRVLIPRAAEARPAIPRILERRGARVDEIHLYRAAETVGQEASIEALRQGVDALTFTSPSTLRGFIGLVRAAGLDPLRLPGSPVVACIGPITADAAAQAGLAPDVVAESYTVDGLVEAVADFYRKGVGP